MLHGSGSVIGPVILLALLSLAASTRAQVTSIRVEGSSILINDQPARLWGVRVAGALESEQTARDLIASLARYRDRGINTLVVYYQGSTGNVRRVFAADGGSFADEAARDRMRSIIAAAAERDMVIIVGLFFPRRMGTGSEDPRLVTRQAYLEAVRLVAHELRDAPNVILSIAHDAGRANWAASPMRFDEADALECLRAAAEAAPRLPRGCGGPDRAFNAAVAASQYASLLFHTEPGGDLPAYDTARPIVNLGLFGRSAGGRGPQGAWNDLEKSRFFKAIDDYSASPQHHLCVHFQGWHEGGMDLRPNRFDIGGDGTPRDPGTAWFLDRLHQKLNPPPERKPPASDRPEGGHRTIFD
jgi:hypothetical protein